MLAAAPPLRDWRKPLMRFAPFVVASIALHAFTFVSYGPGGDSRAMSAQTPVIHAQLTVTPGDVVMPSGPTPVPAEARTQHVVVAEPVRDLAQSSAGADLSMPAPEKWFTAQEVDTRAEPLTSVHIDYPSGTFADGRVRLALYIDERGIVRKANVDAAAPPGLFDELALDTWSNVRFSPAVKSGVAVKSQKLVELYFSPR